MTELQDRAAPLRRTRGFTLLELLVTVAIIGIILGVAVLSVNVAGRQRILEEEAMRLKALVELAAAQAILQPTELGVSVGEDGYEFLAYTAEGWSVVTEEGPLRRRLLPAGLSFALRLSRELIPLERLAETDEQAGDSSERRRPDIILLSDGTMTPFELFVYVDDAHDAYRLKGSPDGLVKLERTSQGLGA